MKGCSSLSRILCRACIRIAVQACHVGHDRSTRSYTLRAASPSPLEKEGEAIAVFLDINATDDAPPPLCHLETDQLDFLPSAEVYTSPYDTFQTLMNADMLSEGSSLDIAVPADRHVTLEDGIGGLKCYFLLALEWVYCIPEFVRLSLDDKNNLIKSCWCDLCALLFAVQNRSADTAFVLANGLSFQYYQIHDTKFQDLVDRILNEVISWFRSMSIDNVEIAHIKALLLFNSGENNLIIMCN